jgi:hypothetical protein
MGKSLRGACSCSWSCFLLAVVTYIFSQGASYASITIVLKYFDENWIFFGQFGSLSLGALQSAQYSVSIGYFLADSIFCRLYLEVHTYFPL